MDSRDFDELEDRARDKLAPGAFAFAAGGADDEITLADNIAAWRRLRLARACCATSPRSTRARPCSARASPRR